ncbi:MAG TPA: response regulator [Bryobacteraceae bacterium]|jgi:CheY-like chemotaxis protein
MSKKKIIAVLSDLMFTVKIQDAAKRAGIETVFVKTSEAAINLARESPAAMILDLNASDIRPLELIEQLKSEPETSNITLIGFISHVQADLKAAAQQKGCDLVVARSAFSQQLPDFLQKIAAESA